MRPLASVLFALALALSFSGCDPREWFVCSLGYCGYAVDDVAPARPSSVVATAGNATVALTWRANEEPDVFSYSVERATAPGGPYTSVASSFGAAVTDTYLLENGKTYYYVVTARDEAGNMSPRSFEVAATPRPDPPPPPLPAPRLSGERFFDDLKLSWSSVPGAQEYRLLRGTAPGGPYGEVTRTIAGFHFDENVEGGTMYYYVVEALDAGGRAGARSNEVGLSPEFIPGSTLGWLVSWGQRGVSSGQFLNPRGIATDAAGNVYVTDNPGEIGRVQKFTGAGVFVSSWPTGFGAYGIAVGSDVFVVERLMNRVVKYTLNGVFVSQWGSSGAGPGAFSAPTGIAVSAAGDVYVVDTGNARVQKFTSSGAFVRSWSVGAGAVGVAVDAGGSVYVADRVTNRVTKYTGDGDFVLDFTGGDGGFSGVEGIGIDPSGRVIATDTGNDRVQIFTTAGVFAVGFGVSGAGAAGFEAPSGVASDCRSNLFVLDTGNSRVQKFGDGVSGGCPAVSPGLPLRAVTSVAGQRRPGFTATMTTSRSTAGVISRSRGLVRERGAGARGTFRGRVVGRSGPSLRAFRAFARGSWRARFDVVADPRSGASTGSGVALVTAGRRGGGQLCLSFRLKVSVRGRVVKTTGSFTTVGGSGPARRLRAAGSFSQTLSGTSAFVLRGDGVGGQRAGRSLPAACRRLR